MTLSTRQGLLAGAFMLLAALASSAAASEKTVTERIEIAGLSAVVWRPAGTARYPLLVFSHGFTACADQAPLLGELIAAAGYVSPRPSTAIPRAPGEAMRPPRRRSASPRNGPRRPTVPVAWTSRG